MKQKERYEKILEYFQRHVPVAETELQYSDPYELLVAVILSAQCTDKRVNLTTPALFRDFPNAESLAASNPETIFRYIKSISYPNNKSKHLVNMARVLVNDFKGVVPGEVEKLVKLPGVGRKTANVIASVVYNKPAMAVDTHVFRVSNRLGLTTNAKNPLQAEKQLIKFIPDNLVPIAHHWLILHGRYTCLARSPKCMECKLTEYCKYFEKHFSGKKGKEKLIDKNNNNGKKENKTNIKKEAGKKGSKENSKESGQEKARKKSSAKKEIKGKSKGKAGRKKSKENGSKEGRQKDSKKGGS